MMSRFSIVLIIYIMGMGAADVRGLCCDKMKVLVEEKQAAYETLCANGNNLPVSCCVDIKKEVKRFKDAYAALCLEKQTFTSCKEIQDKTGAVKSASYKINTSSNALTDVYCQMTSLPGCSGGGWTLVMKTNGNKLTFPYSSKYWNNKVAYNLVGGTTGFDDQETKLPTYYATPFKEICLGMKVNGGLKFISFPYKASSLYDIIADGKYRSTSIGRSKWLSLIANSGLQRNCNREGFNVHNGAKSVRARIGIFANQENDCLTPDSYLGFGGLKSSYSGWCYSPKTTNTCGNAAYCRAGGNINKPAMGYIFVR